MRMGVGGKVGDVIQWVFFFFFFFLLPKNAAIAPPFKIFFIWLYIVGHPFKKYILFGWTYKNAAIGPPFKNTYGPIAIAPP